MNNKKIRPTDTVALLFMIFALASVVYFIVGPMEGYVHADFTDTIYWANASLESGRVVASVIAERLSRSVPTLAFTLSAKVITK